MNDGLLQAFIIFGLIDLTFVGTTTLAVCILVLRILKGRKVEKIISRLEKLSALGNRKIAKGVNWRKVKRETLKERELRTRRESGR